MNGISLDATYRRPVAAAALLSHPELRPEKVQSPSPSRRPDSRLVQSAVFVRNPAERDLVFHELAIMMNRGEVNGQCSPTLVNFINCLG